MFTALRFAEYVNPEAASPLHTSVGDAEPRAVAASPLVTYVASFVMEFFGTGQEWCDLQPAELQVREIDNGNIRVNN